MKTKLISYFAVLVSMQLGGSAVAGITVTQSASPAPAYSNLITFDEPGTPTGGVSSTYYQFMGLTMNSGVDENSFGVADYTGVFPWVGTGNVAAGSFGLFLEFGPGATSISFQAWGDAGTPGPFGGGLWVWALDSNGDPLNFDAFTPSWGGLGDTWYTMTATDGDIIERLYINNNSNIGSETFIDNLSWQPVPAPGGIAILALGLMAPRRRRPL